MEQQVAAIGLTGLAEKLKLTADGFDELTRQAIRAQAAIDALGTGARKLKQMGVRTHQPNGAPRQPEEWMQDASRAILDRAKVRGRVLCGLDEVAPGVEALPSGARYYRDSTGALRRIKEK